MNNLGNDYCLCLLSINIFKVLHMFFMLPFQMTETCEENPDLRSHVISVFQYSHHRLYHASTKWAFYSVNILRIMEYEVDNVTRFDMWKENTYLRKFWEITLQGWKHKENIHALLSMQVPFMKESKIWHQSGCLLQMTITDPDQNTEFQACF